MKAIMPHKVPYIAVIVIVLALVGQACTPALPRATQTAAPPAAPVELSASSTPAAPAVPPEALTTPVAIPTQTLIFTPTPAAVSITAVNGDLAIRLGPSEVFDAVDRLKAGQTLPVSARSIEDGWLQVPIPSEPGTLGWVSSKTGFSRVDGYVLDLPLITAVDWPFGGYVVNCTAHQLVAEPGDKTLPPVGAAPANRVWFYPGLYKVYDTEVQSRPEVTQVKVYEHTQVSVVGDGNGTKYTCP